MTVTRRTGLSPGVAHSLTERASATIAGVEGSHAIMISQPQAVTDAILSAIDAVS